MSLITVIIPCYNQGIYLSEAVASVFDQTHTEWECIIVNDGSTDNTEQVAMEWTKFDKRFHYLKKSNGGLSSARNAGLSNANGEYVQFLDADDMITSTKFSKQLSALNGKPSKTVAISDHYPFDHTTKEFTPRMYTPPFLDEQNFKKEIVTEWEFRRSIPPHNLLIPRSILVENNLRFQESLPTHEDWTLWCQLFYYADGICFQNDKMALFRMHSDSMSNDRKRMNEGFLAATFILETFYNKLGESEYIRCVRKIRKEIKNNLFPYSPGKQIYTTLVQKAKFIIGRFA